MGLDYGPSKLAVLQIAVASSLPFLPALSEDLVFDDLPAVARNKDISASTPVPIFMVSIITCDFIVDVKLRNLLYSRINALFYIYIHIQAILDQKNLTRLAGGSGKVKIWHIWVTSMGNVHKCIILTFPDPPCQPGQIFLVQNGLYMCPTYSTTCFMSNSHLWGVF